MGLALAARGFARVEAKATGRPGYAPGRSQVRQAGNEGETAAIPRNSLLAASPRVLDADARGSFGDQGHPLEDDSRRGDSVADFVNPTSRGNAVTAYWFQPRIESAGCVRPRSEDYCFTPTPAGRSAQIPVVP